ncbi:MAG: WYL domain-containing protein [Actinomycetia bacterium]|nr:WYL domain-containing protein [Actinomycetes bacterium]
MSSLNAADRVARLLNLIPWVESRGSNGASIETLSVDFDYPVEDLVADLTEVVNFVTGDRYGLYGDLVFDVAVADGRMWVNRNDLLGRPLSVDRVELAAAVAAGRAAATQLSDGDGPDAAMGPLARAVAKLSVALGTEADAVEVRLRSSSDGHLEVFQDAITEGRCVEIAYHSYGRDEETTRVVEPHRCLYDGFWYLTANCRLAGAPRVFRLDRVRSAVLVDETFTPPGDVADSMDGIPTDGSIPEVVLELDESVRWVLDQYPNRGIRELEHGVEVVLPVAAARWLERLLLRLGQAARVVAAPDGLGDDLRQAAANRILARYRRG